MTVSEGRPVSMRVVRLRAPGGPARLAVEEADRPRPGPGEALVRVHAAFARSLERGRRGKVVLAVT
jgi:hypothetical protein